MHSLILALPLLGLTATGNVASIAADLRPAVVTISAVDGETVLKTGSGFFLEKDRVVTALHVVAGSEHQILRFANGSTAGATRIVAKSSQYDLAVLEVHSPAVLLPTPVTTAVMVGERVVLLGSPMGLEYSVSDGIISAVRTMPGMGKVLQTTAPMSPGSSGGPLVNLRGQVIGVAVSQLIAGQNLNFAIPVEYIGLLEEVDSSPAAAVVQVLPRELYEALPSLPKRLSPIEIKQPTPVVPVPADPISDTELLKRYQAALNGELFGAQLPAETAKRWKAVAKFSAKKNPYYKLAVERQRAWESYRVRTERKRKEIADAEKALGKKLGLDVLTVEQKVELIRSFAEKHGQVGTYQVGKDEKAAKEIISGACLAGVWEWCLLQAHVLSYNGDKTGGFRLAYSLCKSDFLEACYYAAEVLEGISDDGRSVYEMKKTSCFGGDLKACTNLGYSNGAKANNLEWFQYSCERGVLADCQYMGILLDAVGRESEALEKYEFACGLGLVSSCHLVAVLLSDAKYIKRDYSRSVSIKKKACHGGYSASCQSLGSFYSSGDGVPVNHTEASKYYRRGCELDQQEFKKAKYQTSSHPCIFASEYFLKTPSTRKEGISMLRAACEMGSDLACERLAETK